MSDKTDYVHAGPGTPMGVVLRQFWQPVAVADALLPGRALPIRILHEDLTLYRGEGGTPHVVAFRCAHRGTQLSTGRVEGDCIRCFYHGWKYDETGQCVEMPAEDASFPPKVKIQSYPTYEYAGLVFAFLGDAERGDTGAFRPPFPRKAELDRDYGIQWTHYRVWPCNWFQRIENSVDAVHVSFVHRSSTLGNGVGTQVPTLDFEETDWGIRMAARRSATNVRISELNWPNCNHIVAPPYGFGPEYPWADFFNWFVPIDDDHSAQFGVRSVPVTGEAAREYAARLAAHQHYDPSDMGDVLFARRQLPEETPDPVAAQDYIAQVGQGPIADRVEERLGKSDAGVILLRSIYRREMEAAVAGRPGKQWQPRVGFARLPVPPGVPEAPDVAPAR
jgi:5,5'-dehydrodivanillate O-demethylase oxygenase subunit